ncbi:MAG TPA: glycosyltransferase family 4 protein [Candidatus Dormibacteraeota bacterium]|jgi:glycosyltransferase involved in cell wall biosynthesis
MARPLKIGLYSPFFGSTIGGGEKYFGVTAEAVHQAFPEHDVEIVTPVPVDAAIYEQRLKLDLSGIRMVATNRRITSLHRVLNSVPRLRLYRDLFLSAQAVGYTRNYDLYLAMVYVIPLFSKARRGVMLCQFPYRRGPWMRKRHPLYGLYTLPYRLLRPLMLGDEVESFQDIICQSDYVARWIATYWDRRAAVINPPIDIPSAEPDWSKKSKTILSVGRFFAGGHTKRHDLMVSAFRNLCDQGLRGWELHLAGSVHRERHNAGYFEKIEALASGYPIVFHPDARYEEVQDLYDRAAIYWHAAGYGANAHADPDLFEHFGMTTAEAMAHGTVPVVIGSGGQPEVVRDGVDGYLWTTLEQLKSRTLALTADEGLRTRLGVQARRASHRFSRHEFKRRMVASLRPVIEALEAEVSPTAQETGGTQPQRQRDAQDRKPQREAPTIR